MPTYQIRHSTNYSYGAAVIQSHHVLRLSPQGLNYQQIRNHTISIDPKPAARSERNDYFGNPMVLVSLENEHRELAVVAHSEIAVTQRPALDDRASPPWEAVAKQTRQAAANISQFSCASPCVPQNQRVYDFARQAFGDNMPVLEGCRRLTQQIYEEFRFDNTTTDIATPLEQVMDQKSGVCQDFAHLQIAALRALGLAARYVSGYILTHPPEGEVKLEGSDASHAWLALWVPKIGWVDFDPTNNLVNSLEHIAIAYGRDFSDVSPIGGVLLGGGAHTVSVAVDVKPIAEG